MKKNEFYWVLTIAALVITSFISVIHYYNKDKVISDSQLSATRAEANIYRNKYNESVAEKQSLVGDKNAMKQEVEFWKKQGDTLRSKVTSNTRQIILLKQQLSIAASGKPRVIYDTIPGDTIPMLANPTYQIDTANKWFEAHINVNADRYDLNLMIKDISTEIVSEWKPGGLFKRGHYNVKAISRNPYIENKDLKSVTLQPKKSAVSKAVVLVIGIIAGGLLL